MTGGTPDPARARQARGIALVLAGTMLAWMAAQALGGRMGWPPALALVFDALALAAFGWAMLATGRLWRTREGQE